MAAITPEGTGARKRITIAGEHYYLIATMGDTGKLACLVTVPDQNKPTGQARRETAEIICEELTAMFNDLLCGGSDES